MDKNVKSVKVTPRPCRSSSCEGALAFLFVSLEAVVVFVSVVVVVLVVVVMIVVGCVVAMVFCLRFSSFMSQVVSRREVPICEQARLTEKPYAQFNHVFSARTPQLSFRDKWYIFQEMVSSPCFESFALVLEYR